jgi:peptidoglycan/xylan/chitin deacetylase (PgdA/CDA1 family)
MSDVLPILTFHSIDDERSSVISFPPELFTRLIGRLHDTGYHTISLLEAAECVRRREFFPERAFALTFDDGYASIYCAAFPVLKRYAMHATVFLIAGDSPSDVSLPPFGGRPMLSWNEILEMREAGIDFGAHTMTHPDLTHVSAERIEDEIVRSKTIIERRLGQEVASFAYPFGRYDERSRDIAARHFKCACSDRLGLISEASDPFALERVDAYYLKGNSISQLIGTGLFPWYVKARNIPRVIRRAVQRYSE